MSIKVAILACFHSVFVMFSNARKKICLVTGKSLPHKALPEPVALFPLNVTYGATEINGRASPGNPVGVSFAPAPDGKADGSYKFEGSSNSYIRFPNNEGEALDVLYSMTMLCWLRYDKDGLIFGYTGSEKWGVIWGVYKGNLYANFKKRDYSETTALRHTTLAGGWKFVGASYDSVSGDTKLWVNGVVVKKLNIGEGLQLATQGSVRMGFFGYNQWYLGFKGRIAQMQLYNEALSQGQIQTIQRIQGAGENGNHPLIS